MDKDKMEESIDKLANQYMLILNWEEDPSLKSSIKNRCVAM